VIGDGEGGHAQFGGALAGGTDMVRAIEQAEFGVEVEVDKWNLRISHRGVLF